MLYDLFCSFPKLDVFCFHFTRKHLKTFCTFLILIFFSPPLIFHLLMELKKGIFFPCWVGCTCTCGLLCFIQSQPPPPSRQLVCLSSPCLFSVLPTSVIARLKIRTKNRGESVFLLYFFFLSNKNNSSFTSLKK